MARLAGRRRRPTTPGAGLFALPLGLNVARPVSIAAAVLYLPYGLWVTFATALNLAIWKLNHPPGPP
jgi:tryptophan-rich sensory protein